VSFEELAERIAQFEAGPTQPGRTTGEAKEGTQFEGHVLENICKAFCFMAKISNSNALLRKVKVNGTKNGLFAIHNSVTGRAVACYCRVKSIADSCRDFIGLNSNLYIALEDSDYKSLVIKGIVSLRVSSNILYDGKIEDLYSKGHVPENMGRDDYKRLYHGTNMKFDGILMFVEGIDSSDHIGVDKIRSIAILEIKSAKSSNGRSIDGNAHERFSFQMLQYLILSEYVNKNPHLPNVSLLLMTNSSFLRYNNKYHAAFGIHSLLLSTCSSHFRFRMISDEGQYASFFTLMHKWIQKETDEIPL